MTKGASPKTHQGCKKGRMDCGQEWPVCPPHCPDDQFKEKQLESVHFAAYNFSGHFMELGLSGAQKII